ncbi:hypothetical protein PCLA_02r0246 [Pseudomonas citronellolis]|nr:hypothetical protein PCLA_02r0246 [Pseudomonas citronellolis]
MREAVCKVFEHARSYRAGSGRGGRGSKRGIITNCEGRRHRR